MANCLRKVSSYPSVSRWHCCLTLPRRAQTGLRHARCHCFAAQSHLVICVEIDSQLTPTNMPSSRSSICTLTRVSTKQLRLDSSAMSSTGTMPDGPSPSKLRYIPLSYNTADSEKSALRLVLSVHPEWEGSEGPIEFTRFTDGITNTVRFSSLQWSQILLTRSPTAT